MGGAGDSADLHVEDAAGEGGAGAGDLDVCSAEGGVEIGGGGVFAEREREGFELLIEGRGGVVACAGDASAVEVDGSEGLEDVVELSGGEVDGDGLIAGDVAGVLEEAYAVFVEGYAGDGELRGFFGRGGFGCGLLWRGPCGLCGKGGGEGEDEQGGSKQGRGS